MSSRITKVGRKFIKLVLFVAVAVAVVSTLIFACSLVLPNGDEYDDPDTNPEESFPWNPNILTNWKEVLRLLGMGVLRHLAVLRQHVRSSTLIVLAGYIFVTMFLYRIRRTFLNLLDGELGQIGMSTYVEWSFGSIVGAILFLAGIVGENMTLLASIATGIAWLSLSAFIMYLVYPDLGLLSAIARRVNPRILCSSCKEQVPQDSKFCLHCGKEITPKEPLENATVRKASA